MADLERSSKSVLHTLHLQHSHWLPPPFPFLKGVHVIACSSGSRRASCTCDVFSVLWSLLTSTLRRTRSVLIVANVRSGSSVRSRFPKCQKTSVNCYSCQQLNCNLATAWLTSLLKNPDDDFVLSCRSVIKSVLLP